MITQGINTTDCFVFKYQDTEAEVAELSDLIQTCQNSFKSNDRWIGLKQLELSTNRDRLRKVDPYLINENRSSSRWTILKISAHVFYVINLCWQACFGDLEKTKHQYVQLRETVNFFTKQNQLLQGKIEALAHKLLNAKQKLFELEAAIKNEAFIKANALIVYKPNVYKQRQDVRFESLQSLPPVMAVSSLVKWGASVWKQVNETLIPQTLKPARFIGRDKTGIAHGAQCPKDTAFEGLSVPLWQRLLHVATGGMQSPSADLEAQPVVSNRDRSLSYSFYGASGAYRYNLSQTVLPVTSRDC